MDDFQTLGTSRGSITFTTDDSVNPQTAGFMIYTSNRVIFESLGTTLQFNEKSGIFFGSFVLPNGKISHFEGICVQQPGDVPDFAVGFFDSGVDSGRVEIQAQR
jgi:hypothetical protein